MTISSQPASAAIVTMLSTVPSVGAAKRSLGANSASKERSCFAATVVSVRLVLYEVLASISDGPAAKIFILSENSARRLLHVAANLLTRLGFTDRSSGAPARFSSSSEAFRRNLLGRSVQSQSLYTKFYLAYLLKNANADLRACSFLISRLFFSCIAQEAPCQFIPPL